MTRRVLNTHVDGYRRRKANEKMKGLCERRHGYKRSEYRDDDSKTEVEEEMLCQSTY